MEDGKDIKEIISEVDGDNVSIDSALSLFLCVCVCKTEVRFRVLRVQDGRINYDEFAAMMRKGNPEAAANQKKRREVVFAS